MSFQALQVFDLREAFVPDYQVPVVDTTGFLLPDAPVIKVVESGTVEWGAVSGATGYVVEIRSSGNQWQPLAEVGEVLVYEDAGVIGPAYFRVHARNSVGLGAPSHPMFLEEDSSS